MLLNTNKKQSLGIDAAVLTFSRFAGYCISLVATMLLSRFRTLEEYGTYSQMIMVVNLVTTILMLGLPNCMNYFLARAETQEEKNKFLSIYYTFNTVLSFIVGLILVLIVPLIEAYFKNPFIKNFTYFLLIFPWTKIITSSVENLLIVFKKTEYLIFYRISHSICVVLSILIVQFLSWTFSHFLFLYLTVEAFYAFVIYILATKLGGRLSIKWDKVLLKSILIFSIPLGLSVATGTLKAEMDKLLIGFLFSTEELALYANAAKELPLTMIASSLTAVLLPQIAILLKKEKTQDAIKLWKDATVLSLIINCYFAIGLFVFSKEAMTFLYSEKYISASNVFAIYSLNIIIRSTYFGMILNSSGNTKFILNSSIISLVLNFILNILFYFIFGFIGPAIATIITSFWNAYYLLYKTSKVLKIGIKEIYPWKTGFRILLVNIVCAISFKIVQNYVPIDKIIGSIGEVFLLSFVWAAIIFIIFFKKFAYIFSTMKNQNK